MRIQFVSHEAVGIEKAMDHGGVGISQRVVAEGLARRGHHVELLLPSDKEWNNENAGVKLRGWKSDRRRFVGIFRNMKRQKQLAADFAKGDSDAFTIIPDVGCVSWPYPLASIKVIKFTCTHLLQKHEAHHDRPNFLRAIAEKLMVPRANAFFSISARTADVSAHLFKIARDQIVVIPNAVDTEMFRPPENESRDPNLLLYTGTVCEKKGAWETVAALRILEERYPNLKLLMIGRNGVDYNNRGDFIGRIKTAFPDTCHSRVEFRGHVKNDELPSIYRKAAVVVLPSYYESFGRTTIEAMACGAAVVRSDSPPASEIISDGIDGLLCRTKDAEDLAKKIDTLLCSPELRQSLGAKARKTSVTRFSVDVVVEMTEAFLKNLLDEERRFNDFHLS